MNSQIRDIKLAPSGHAKMNWVESKMPVLHRIRQEFIKEQPFKGKRITVCIHLEAKTGILARVLKDGGAEVAVVASNPLSTQDDVVAALVEHGITAFAWHGATAEEYHAHLEEAVKFSPDLMVDDGGDLTVLLHSKYTELLDKVIGGSEETTTGVIRLRSLDKEGKLRIPMVAVNDAQCKYLFDNRYGTGQSVWDAVTRTTNLIIAGKTVVVAGYGWCGKGVALRAKGMGAKIIVTEIDPIKAAEAWMDGFDVMQMKDAIKEGDIFVTVTGNRDVVSAEHLKDAKDGAIFSNAGHFDIEISKPGLEKLSKKVSTAKPGITEYEYHDGRKVYLLGEGRLVNLACGDGHPAEIMDMSFALQAMAMKYLATNPKLAPGVYNVPKDLDERVAKIKLETLGSSIDELTPEQAAYLDSWNLD